LKKRSQDLEIQEDFPKFSSVVHKR